MATKTAHSLPTRAKLFRGFADESRLAIIEALRDGPRNVGDVVEDTGLSQSNVSNHLACLRDCGLVLREPRGRYAYYRLTDSRVSALLRTADALLDDVAMSVEACGRYDPVEGG